MPRNKQGRFRTSRVITILMILLAAFIAFNVGFSKWYNNEIMAVAPVAYAGETMEAKVEALKEKLADDMVACENKGHLLVWPDDNSGGTLPRKDKVSIGDLAFKISTVQRFYKILHGADLNDRDAMQLALDTPRARQLAIDSWLNIKGSINEWSCVTDEMKTTVEDIRFLTH